MTVRDLLLRILIVLAGPCWLVAAEAPLRLEPAAPVLRGSDARQQLLVTGSRDGRDLDLTAVAKFRSSNPAVALVRDDGVLLPVSDGVARITATVENLESSVDVAVQGAQTSLPLHFNNDIIPLLTKAGCNSGGCHGKQSGQNGFKLSVFGHDAAADYESLIHEGRGRRLFPAVPGQSLLLAKASNRVPHGGGRRLEEDSIEYRRLLRWVVSGVPKGADDAVQVVRIEVHPKQRVMTEKSQQQLLVTAYYSDDTLRDVTHETLYSSNDETLAHVDARGRIATTMLAGEAAIVARYREQVASSRITVPLNKDLAVPTELAKWNRSHFIDRLVADKWEQLHLFPSAEADDTTFHRRVFLDVIGKLPTPDEVTTFVADTRSDKRAQLVDKLLARPEYADHWALKWADLLRINREDLGPRPAYQYHQWLKESLQQNRPYDQFLRELLTAQGSNERNGAVNFFTAFPNPNDLTIAVSQVFLGVRLECARCHHHPYEKWGQEDFYGLAAFFPRMQKKKGDGTELTFFVGDKGEVRHPRTNALMRPKALLGEPLDPAASGDPREVLAAWVTAPQNPFVARTLVNRVWAQLMGRGLVEPIDDMRDTNPSTNEPLLKALSQDFIEHQFDIRQLIRTITTSRVYGLSSQPNVSNARDTQNYSRAYRKRLGAEVLLDAVSDVTGDVQVFAGMPPGTRAVQLWDHRLPSSFLDTFGRPQRKTVCQCERVAETSLGQVLHLMNAPVVSDKIASPAGRAASLAASERSVDDIIGQLYLATFGRPPREAELSAARQAFTADGATRRSAAEDVLWALLNSAEFVLNH